MIPWKDLYTHLLSVEQPARYCGGEFGCAPVKENPELRIAISFPDLYEVGMSNQAVRILYNIINEMPGIMGERVYAPAMDFEKVLLENSIPLYTLETYTPVKDCDALFITLGYELCITNVLTILHTSQIAQDSADRIESDPIIIGGGPASTNPAPFGSYFDAVVIGEAEPVMDTITEILKERRQGLISRSEALLKIKSLSYVWTADKNETVQRSVWQEFGKTDSYYTYFPVPNIRAAQDHAAIEIMRGCPQGCRFCHAGIYYRPFRMKKYSYILKEIDYYVSELGFRSVSLSSLSSGDFSGILELVQELNKLYSKHRVNFALPSLRVSSLNLPIIEQLSETRKSGLTFAIETPEIKSQHSMNKDVPRERVIELLKEARQRGWKKAKFYFMLGLPVFREQPEDEAIANYILEVQKETKMQLNVNVGTFVPKPHTPFQWSRQLTDPEAYELIKSLKDKVRHNRSIRISYHSPFQSMLEGVITRGNAETKKVIEKAYNLGARLDAWEEHFSRDIWREAISELDVDTLFKAKETNTVLPWSSINLGTSNDRLKSEKNLADNACLSKHCSANCGDNCGQCTAGIKPRVNNSKKIYDALAGFTSKVKTLADTPENPEYYIKAYLRYTKKDSAIFLPHLSLVRLFNRGALRSGLPVRYSEGFNPKPKIEFTQPLSLGVSSSDEVASIELNCENPDKAWFLDIFNQALGKGIKIHDVWFEKFPVDRKPKSLMSMYRGGEYTIEFPKPEWKAAVIDKLLNTDTYEEFNILEDHSEHSLSIKQNAKASGSMGIKKLLKNILDFDPWFQGIKCNRNKLFIDFGEK